MSIFSRFIRVGGGVGAYWLARNLTKNEPKILMYHRFSSSGGSGATSVENFDHQVRYIKKHFRAFTLRGLIRFHREEGKFPERAVVITVDDGYRDFYTHALPVLVRHGLPATLYATTGFVNRDLWLWPDRISWLLSRAKESPKHLLADLPYANDIQGFDNDAIKQLWSKWVEHALTLDDDDKHKFIDQLAQGMGVAFPEDIPDEYAPVTWSELEEIENAGIEVGGHTVTHPSLGRVAYEQAEREISGSLAMLDEMLGIKERTFCYPNGQPNDFKEFLPKLVERFGYVGAVTAFPDSLGVSQRFLMRRHASGNDMFQFYKAVNGVELLGLKVRKDIKLNMPIMVDSNG